MHYLISLIGINHRAIIQLDNFWLF